MLVACSGKKILCNKQSSLWTHFHQLTSSTLQSCRSVKYTVRTFDHSCSMYLSKHLLRIATKCFVSSFAHAREPQSAVATNGFFAAASANLI